MAASQRILISSAPSADHAPTVIRLERITAGTELGVGVTHVNAHDGYAVSFRESNGTLNGRRFKTLEEARALFKQWTTPAGDGHCTCGGIDAVPHATDHTEDCGVWT